jgi:predicted membrane-bound spermidine synthase
MSFFAIFFAVSGFCSLVYQVAWLRIAMAGFGVTSTMIAIVLSVFMAGLSFGSWGGGRVATLDCFKSPGSHLRLYGVLEGIIGLSGVLSAPLLGYGQMLLAKSSGTEWGSGSYYLATGAIVFIALFPFCVCMGATFPVAMASLRRAYPGKSATSFSYLYLANLLGAVLGCIGTAFVLIELLGFRGSMLGAVALNFAVALTAFFMSGRLPDTASSAGDLTIEPVRDMSAPVNDWILYAVLVTTGLTSMALEVIWTRQFTLFLGPVVYTFASILALFLVANYAGSGIYRKKRGHALFSHNNLLLALLIAFAGFTAVLTLLTADYRLPFPDGILGGLTRVASGVIPFGLTLGFITSWVVDRLSAGAPEKAGTAYSLNTVGCILGPLVAGFVLLPLIGERWSILLLAALLFLLSYLLLKGMTREKVPVIFSDVFLRGILILVTAVSLLLVIFTRGYESRYPGSVVLRDHTATVIAAGTGWDRQLLVNGYGMTELTPITKMMVHLPMAFHDAPPRNGLVLCFGMGTSFRSMLSWGVPTTVVELVPSIPRLFGYYHHDAESLVADPNARIIIDDARRYLSRSSEHYDVILVDPPPPIEAAASSLLYSVEFYRDVARRLATGGVFQQWTDINEPYLVSSITRSLATVFPYVRAFNSMEGWGVHYIASMQPLPDRSAVELAAKLSPKAAADLVEWGPFSTPIEQFGAVLNHEHGMDELIRGAPGAREIEDDRPVNEYFFLRRYCRR